MTKQSTYQIGNRTLSGLHYFTNDAINCFPTPEEMARLPKHLQSRLTRVKLALEFTERALRTGRTGDAAPEGQAEPGGTAQEESLGRSIRDADFMNRHEVVGGQA
jgi:hypothetical protein